MSFYGISYVFTVSLHAVFMVYILPLLCIMLSRVRHGILMVVLGFRPDLMVISGDQYLNHHQIHLMLLITIELSVCRKLYVFGDSTKFHIFRTTSLYL